jgi:hypothetical protein
VYCFWNLQIRIQSGGATFAIQSHWRRSLPTVTTCSRRWRLAAKKAEEKYRKEQLKLKQRAERVKSPPASAAFGLSGLSTSFSGVGSLIYDDVASGKQTARKSCGGPPPRASPTVASMLAQARQPAGRQTFSYSGRVCEKN